MEEEELKFIPSSSSR